ncbi:MAG TPA: hypothetical protein VF062_07890 [Candidatus Limnocylindrales bacterium]
MRYSAALICASALLTAATVVGYAPAHASNPAVIPQPFNVDSGDPCGFTGGKLDWQVGRSRPQVEQVTIQVCRTSSDGSLSYCGAVLELRRPPVA